MLFIIFFKIFELIFDIIIPLAICGYGANTIQDTKLYLSKSAGIGFKHSKSVSIYIPPYLLRISYLAISLLKP